MRTTLTVNLEWWNARHGSKTIPPGHREDLITIGLQQAADDYQSGMREGGLAIDITTGAYYRGWWSVTERTEDV